MIAYYRVLKQIAYYQKLMIAKSFL